MRNYKLTIAYDGTQYQGWQRQTLTEHTIQGIVERAIGEVVGYQVTIDGSGRTDSGVHALGQTANVKLSGKTDERQFRDALNQALPEDIRIREVALVKNSFHSRLSAAGKTYRYTIDRRERPDVFTRKYTYHCTKALNLEKMKEAALPLTGTHDFLAFTDKKDEKASVRTIYEIKIEERGEKVILTYHGSGFLYHMVRILTGTLIEAGAGERKPEEIKQIIKQKARSGAGFLAPAQGLCLMEVQY